MSPTKTIYFGYGSNLWLHQMKTRCPTSTYLGIARLNNYKWIINDRGYANIVQIPPSTSSTSSPSTGTTPSSNTSAEEDYKKVVFGLVYSLEPLDEERLDRNEGVPIAYTKEDLSCDFWEAEKNESGGKVDTSKPPILNVEVLVYIDRKRVTDSTPKEEYIYRMNKGIHDAIKMGVPEAYVEQVMRRFIPKETEEEGRKSTEEKALRQAKEFVDESGVMQ